MQRFFALVGRRLIGLVRVEVGKARQCQDLAGDAVEHETAGTLGMEAQHRLAELARHGLLDPEIEAEDHRLAGPVIAERAAVERVLHAGEAVIVDVDEAQHVARQAAVRVDAMLGHAESDAGNAELENGLLLRRA